MSWKDNLLEASFRGIVFDVISTDDDAERSHARHEYPYQDGGDVEDMGRHVRLFKFQAILFGDDYDQRLQKLIAALDEPGPGVLVHPVFGNIDHALACGYRIRHHAEEVDSCTISLDFEESVPAQPFFSRQLSSQKADAVGMAAKAARAASGNVLIDKLNELAAMADQGSLGALAQINALRGQAVSFLSGLKSAVGGIVSSIANPIRAGIAFVADVTTLTHSIIDIVPNNLEFLQNYTRSTLNKVDRLLSDPAASWKALQMEDTYPISVKQRQANTQILTTHIAVERATLKSEVIGLVLASESAEPTMTPQQVESLVSEVRDSINDAIAAARARYGIEEARAITEPLKTLALNVQDAGKAVIMARPPLMSRKIEAPAPLRLLAHRWYGDHARASELLRLNNLRLPNMIAAGDTLNGYSR